ncbi:hypothetical protein AFLA_008123 [Aspergillus flavus NRRL3357]|nr:hypothetical protein AFLA_008123 [Aspergillus flavus NRRL3357]
MRLYLPTTGDLISHRRQISTFPNGYMRLRDDSRCRFVQTLRPLPLESIWHLIPGSTINLVPKIAEPPNKGPMLGYFLPYTNFRIQLSAGCVSLNALDVILPIYVTYFEIDGCKNVVREVTVPANLSQ